MNRGLNIAGNTKQPEPNALKAVSASTLESVIAELSRYGRPLISQYSRGGWYARVDVNNSAEQTTVEVKGKGNSVSLACEQCLKNVKSTVAALATKEEQS